MSRWSGANPLGTWNDSFSSRAWLEEATVWPGRFANLLFWWQAGGFFCLGRIFLVDDNRGEGGEIASLSFFTLIPHTVLFSQRWTLTLTLFTSPVRWPWGWLAKSPPGQTASLCSPVCSSTPCGVGHLLILQSGCDSTIHPDIWGLLFRNTKLEIPWERGGERHPTLRVMG